MYREQGGLILISRVQCYSLIVHLFNFLIVVHHIESERESLVVGEVATPTLRALNMLVTLGSMKP